MAKTLSAVRDAAALIETVDYLASEAGSPEALAALATASAALIERRHRIASEETDLAAKLAAAAETCREAIRAVEKLQLNAAPQTRTEAPTSEIQSPTRISTAVLRLQKNT